MKSLKEICMIAILKLEMDRNQLPEILITEIAQYESLIVATLKGNFYADPTIFRVQWHQGMTTLCLHSRAEVHHEDGETVHIESGKLSTLGDC